MSDPNSLVKNVPQNQGKPLPADLRQSMEATLGHDFSDVRVHTDVNANAAARAASAQAYTQGSDIYFAPGQFQPGTDGGRSLLAHELTHVVQQSQGRVKPTTTR